ncbi:MAG: putative dihydrodipicolinate synthase/N-acetylneuraminate lyase [candidate division NC10 bacterium]|jgi:4-hydroxy-tetrahydrodipicolinate synthase|nr:putative dihydrodipicolinate synthase/N-acetylneuraminate lyase [candidate division NC10 bacterium]
MTRPLRGILAALATPFTADGSKVNEAGLRELVDGLIAAGIHGVIPCGSTGEFPVLSMAERKRIAEVVMEQVAGRVPVVPHTGSCSTVDAIELSCHAEHLGADAVMVVQPYYEPTSLEELYDYFKDVSDAIHIPMMIYNNPVGTGMNPPVSFWMRIAREIPNVKYVKDSSGNISQVSELLLKHGREVVVFNGCDTIAFPVLAMGSPGAVWGAANVIPEQCAELFNLTDGGHLTEARDLWAKIWPVNQFLVTEGYTASVKAGANLYGFHVGNPRPPYRPLAPEKVAELRQLMITAGAIK